MCGITKDNDVKEVLEEILGGNMMKKEEGYGFASEILAEVKAQSKRNFILFILMLVLEAFTIAWFTLPTKEESVDIRSEGNSDASYYDDSNSQIGGDINNVGKNYSGQEREEVREDDELQED